MLVVFCVHATWNVWRLAYEPIMRLVRFTSDVNAEQLKEEYEDFHLFGENAITLLEAERFDYNINSLVGVMNHGQSTMFGLTFWPCSSARQMLRECSPFCGKCTQKRATACMHTRLLHTCNACSTLTAATMSWTFLMKWWNWPNQPHIQCNCNAHDYSPTVMINDALQ